METVVRERAEAIARRYDVTGPDAIWSRAETKRGELCLIAKKVDGVWRGFSACGNMAWGPMEADEQYTHPQFERAMIHQTARVISEMEAAGQWQNGEHLFA